MRVPPGLFTGLITVQLCTSAVSSAQDAPQAASTKTMALQAAADLPRGRLDLRPPKITELFSEATINQALRAAAASRTIEEVEVEGRRERLPPNTPAVPPGILAPFWALLNPTQAWRIFVPLPPDRAEGSNAAPPAATDPYRPVMLGPAFR